MNIDKNEKINLLLVEDDADFKKSLASRLSKRNYNVTAVESAEEALEQIESEIFEVIVSDIKLNGMDGLEFLSRVKSMDEDLPVILITGYANLETARKAVALNAYNYLIKPLSNISDLIIPIKNAVSNYKLKQENKILKEHYENIVSSVPDGILTINTSFEIESVNNAFLEMFKTTEDQLLNKNIEEIFDEKISDHIKDVMDSLGLEGNLVRFEWTKTDKAEDKLWADITLKRAIIGKKESILMVVSDITALKKAEEAKKNIEVQYIQMQKQESIGSLTHGIAHEFNNILSIILGHAQLSIAEESLDEIKQSLSEIEKATIRGSSLVENMTSFATPYVPELRPQDIRETIDNVFEMQKRQLHLQNIKVNKDYANKLIALYDQGQMEQVFINLLINSMHAIKPNKKGEVSITVKDLDGQVIIVFADNGIGIDEKIKDKIFDPFFTTKGAYARDDHDISGTGLGLSVTNGIIKQHHGTISVASEKNKGATFTITLPAVNKAELEKKKKPDSLNDIDIEQIKKLRILLVDDEEEMVRLMKLVFKKAGFKNVIVEDNGKKAIASFHSFNPDIVFLDMIMPDMNGKDVFNEIKTINKDIPVVFMSGKINVHKDEIKREGSYDFIKKPFNINDLYRILSRVITNNEIQIQ